MSGSSLDVQFLTLRNITAYNPDNSFVSSGNVLVVQNNGQAQFSNSVSSLNISSLDTDNISAKNINTIYLTAQSTISTPVVLFPSFDSGYISPYTNDLFVIDNDLYFDNTKITGITRDAFWELLSGTTIVPQGTYTVSTLRNMIVGSTLTVNNGGANIIGNTDISGNTCITGNLSTNTLNMINGVITGLSTINGVKYDPSNDTYWSTIGGTVSSNTSLPITIGTSLSTNVLNMTNGVINGLSTINGNFSTVGSLGVTSTLTVSTISSLNGALIQGTLSTNTLQMTTGVINGLSTINNSFTISSSISGSYTNLTIGTYSGTNSFINSDQNGNINIQASAYNVLVNSNINISGSYALSTNTLNMTTGVINGLSTINGNFSTLGSLGVTSTLTVSTLTFGNSTTNIISTISGGPGITVSNGGTTPSTLISTNFLTGGDITIDVSGSYLVFDVSGGGASQWYNNGSNIYFNTGNVGIGTNSPQAKLDVSGGTSSSIIIGTNTYDVSGSLNTISIPSGATYASFEILGGGGTDGYQASDISGGIGGYGGYISGIIDLSDFSGNNMSFYVGTNNFVGDTSGNYSYIDISGTKYVIAGGGGNGGNSYDGSPSYSGNGGYGGSVNSSGTNGTDSNGGQIGYGGGGGSIISPGIGGGSQSFGYDGSGGIGFSGGAGYDNGENGGNGGWGYFGGGGGGGGNEGGNGGGGGGGSSYANTLFVSDISGYSGASLPPTLLPGYGRNNLGGYISITFLKVLYKISLNTSDYIKCSNIITYSTSLYSGIIDVSGPQTISTLINNPSATGYVRVVILAIGGGGGGGGGAGNSGGGGGGSGQEVSATYYLEVSSQLIIVIGTGGTGGTNSVFGSGGAGGITTVSIPDISGGYIRAKGGFGGINGQGISGNTGNGGNGWYGGGGGGFTSGGVDCSGGISIIESQYSSYYGNRTASGSSGVNGGNGDSPSGTIGGGGGGITIRGGGGGGGSSSLGTGGAGGTGSTGFTGIYGSGGGGGNGFSPNNGGNGGNGCVQIQIFSV